MRCKSFLIAALSISFAILEASIEESGVREITFKQEDIDLVVSLANQVRALNMTPVAADMRLITWDEDIAEFSVNWTNQCQYILKENTTTELWSELGQSYFVAAAGWSEDFHYSSVLRWLRQQDNFNFEEKSCSDFCGEFYQLAYSKTFKMGCSATFCPVLETSTNEIYEDATIYMCAFYPMAPSGTGYHPYNAGKACASCSNSEDTCTDFKLCTHPDRELSLRERKLKAEEEAAKAAAEAAENAKSGWSLMQTAIASITGGIGMLAGVGAVIKLCKGASVGPTEQPIPEAPAAEEPPAEEQAPPPAEEQEEIVTNGKAPTAPIEAPES